MPLNLANDVRFTGPALPETFVHLELEALLKPFLPKGKDLQEAWREVKRALGEPLSEASTRVRVRNIVLGPLAKLAGYQFPDEAESLVRTREGNEPGGLLLRAGDVTLRTWTFDAVADLDAPIERGKAYRYTPARIAARVLKATNEDFGLLVTGEEVRLVLDPARSDSHVTFLLNPWRRLRVRDDIPDGFALLLALLSPEARAKLPDILDKARLTQGQVTKDLRVQAREAVEGFVNLVLKHPANREVFADVFKDDAAPADGETRAHVDDLAHQLWRESLVLVYRLLFALKGETSGAFGFASLSLWRRTYSPSAALADVAVKVREERAETGRYLEDGLRHLFRIFEEGIACPELKIDPLGGQLFGSSATPLLSKVAWGEDACAILLDKLLRAPRGKGKARRLVRLSYRDLGVEELGRVYEALLELTPQITHENVVALRRAKLEVVVPAAQAEKYKPANGTASDDSAEDVEDEEAAEEEETEGKKVKVEWLRAIPKGEFILTTGLGRKASGAYYTPDTFVRFLVRETLGPQVDRICPKDDPQPGAILKLKVCDPAMGSGHFLVGACRYLAERLYEAARTCAERGMVAENQAEKTTDPAEKKRLGAEAEKWWRRVIDLPDHRDELLRYLPGRVVEGDADVGLSPEKARMVCRRLVAVHCLYGVDKNPLAVELAKLSLWLESQAEGMPLTFMDHRLVVGDSLTGPFWTHLLHRPSNNEILADDLFTRNLYAKFTKVLSEAIREVNLLEKDVGPTVQDNDTKRAEYTRLHALLAPFRVVAAAWAGGVMLGPEQCSDDEYVKLLRHVADTGELPQVIGAGDPEKKLLCMIAKGLGVSLIPSRSGRDEVTCNDVLALLDSGECTPALPYDLAFPEVFYPTGVPQDRRGFDAVIGNPPWERMLPADKEFFAGFDFGVLAAPTKRERETLERRLKDSTEIKSQHDQYIGSYREAENIVERLYQYQVAEIDGKKTIGKLDAYRVFMERNAQLLVRDGRVGLVVPSAFHANEGATGIRRYYLEKNALACCFSFENRRKIFEIDSRFKFATVVAQRHGEADTTSDEHAFLCAFYLHDDRWLDSEKQEPEPLSYTIGFVKRTGGEYLSLLELRTKADLEVARRCYEFGEPFVRVCERLGISLSRELNMTDDAHRFTPTSRVLPDGEDPRDPAVAKRLLEQGYLVLHEGKTFHQFNDRWGDRPRYLVNLSEIAEKSSWLSATRFSRLAFRDIASSTNERTVIFDLASAGSLFGHTAICERTPNLRNNASALSFSANMNAYTFDWAVRLRATTHVSLYVLNGCPLPLSFFSNDWHETLKCRFLAHSALRLVCNHEGHRPLWEEQVGDVWREPGKAKFAWPVLEGDDARWAVRAAIDAVVAQAYGLSREQYAHVLSSFSHKSYPKAPDLCLAAFDELTKLGLDAFCKKHDPYHDIPLNMNLPKPVIELPVPDAPEQAAKVSKRKGKKAKGDDTQGNLL